MIEACDSDWLRLARASVRHIKVGRDVTYHDDCESSALLSMWRAWERNPSISESHLFRAARRGAIDGFRSATGWRRTEAGGMARESETVTFSQYSILDPEWWIGYRQPEPEPEPDDRTVGVLMSLHPPMNPRDAEMIMAWAAGETLQSIGARYGVSAVRVSQIAAKWCAVVKEKL